MKSSLSTMKSKPLILFIRSSHPFNTGSYYSRALRKCDVELEEICFDPDNASLTVSLPKKKKWNFILICDSGRLPNLESLESYKCPKGFISIDSCHKLSMHQEFIKRHSFDHVWVAQKNAISSLGDKASWLPLAADEAIHCYDPALLAKISIFSLVFKKIFLSQPSHYDIGMCAAPYPHRKKFEKLFKKNKWKTNFHYRKKFGTLATLELSRCTLGFNAGAGFDGRHGKDINMRVFETMANGFCGLLTNIYDGLGFEDLFDEGKHYIGYRSQEEAVEKAHYYIEHPSEALNIAKAGQRLVMERHLYVHRAREILKILE